MKAVTAARMQRIDERAIHEFGIPAIVLMENAGIACAEEILRAGRGRFRWAAVLCGGGNNGGDGFVVARHLFNHGMKVKVWFFQQPRKMSSEAVLNFRILKKQKVALIACGKSADLADLENHLRKTDVLVDALFGTGLSRNIEGVYRTAIGAVNAAGRPVFSVDVPSGLNADTGQAAGVCVKADVTVTFGLPKKGFFTANGRRLAGRVKVKSISLPKELLR